MAMQTLVIIALIAVQASSGFMVPEMVHRMASGRGQHPPLQPHIQGTRSAQCEADIQDLIAPGNLELFQVVDAIGKPGAGLQAGNLAWFGHYDECRSIEGFQYCMSYIHIPNPTNGSFIPAGLGEAMQLLWGLCVPQSCSEADVLNSLQDFIDIVEAPLNISAVNASYILCAKDPPLPYSKGFVVMMCLLAVVTCLMLLGAFLDSTLRVFNIKRTSSAFRPIIIAINDEGGRLHDAHSDASGTALMTEWDQINVERETQEEEMSMACTKAWHQFLLCFAVNRNLEKLLRGKSGEGGIDCLNGIRVISMFWVILGHTALFMGTGVVANPEYVFGLFTQFGYQAIGNAFFSVDTFFFLSGLLVAYIALGKMMKTGGSLNWFWFYFHRYWRLTPPLVMATLIDIYIRPYLGSGPLWASQTAMESPCVQDWWTNLLYINNFYKGNCLSWVWYLANDMQFYVISPILLIMLYRMPKLGLSTLGVLCGVSIVTTALLMAKYGFEAYFLDFLNPHPNIHHNFVQEIYYKPYCRIAPYLVGMAMGYALQVYKNRQFKIPMLLVIVGWITAAAIGMTLVYGLYGNYHGNVMTTAGSAAYMALSRFAWAVCLSWVVFACRYGYGGWINDFLSWELWIPMSRLTYAAYLLHPSVIIVYQSNQASNYYVSNYLTAFEFTSFVTLSYCAAILMALFVEFPCGNLEKLMMPASDKKKK